MCRFAGRLEPREKTSRDRMEEDPAGDNLLAEQQVRSAGKQSGGEPLEHDLVPGSLPLPTYLLLRLCPK